MAITGLLSPLQRTVSNRATSFATAVTPPVQSAVRGSSWLVEYLEKQAEEEAKKKAEAEEAAAFEAQKQSHKENADFIYEGADSFNATGTINPSNGAPANWFIDVKSEDYASLGTGGGDDVVYLEGDGGVNTGHGDDIVYLEGLGDGLEEGNIFSFQSASLGFGDDTVIGGKGSQYASGSVGDDYFDLGDGNDLVKGGVGADKFIIDLKNTGKDVILDFADVGDRITVLNGGESAQAGDWCLQKLWSSQYSSQFEGGATTSQWLNSLEKPQDLYEIKNSDGQTAAIFGIGTKQGVSGNPHHYFLEATMDSSGIEIVSSEPLDDGLKGSMDFV
jgi:hypothetical protein